jgi:hypothetical protein
MIFLSFVMTWNLVIQKGKWQPNKNKMIRGMIKSVTQTFLFWEETQQVDG